jgi:endonuclease-3
LIAPIAEVIAFFDRVYPEPRCGLDFWDPFQLLVATILSAQCTDKRVNLVTPKLFAAFPTPKAMAEADLGAIEELVKTCGLYRAKAANISKMSKILMERFGGQVPATIEELVTLPGVGRKTANVVLGDAFGIPGLTVDTHLGRVSRRLGLSRSDNAERVERDLMILVPQQLWTRFSHQAINHGRSLCLARKPLCGACGLTDCPSRPTAD